MPFGGVVSKVRSVGKRVSRATRPRDVVPSIKRAIRPQDIPESIRRLHDPSEWDEILEEKIEALKKWVLKAGEVAYMEPPVLKLINPHGHTTEPVVYVNGLNTAAEEAEQDAYFTSIILQRPVQLLYNHTSFGYAEGSTWYEEYTQIGTDGIEAIWDTVYNEGMPQYDHTTRQLTHLIYYAGEKVSLITHSQGCLKARNAIHTVAFLGESSQVKHNLRWIACGSPVIPGSLQVLPDKFKDLVIPGDFVAQILGTRGGRDWQKRSRRRHAYVWQDERNSTTGQPTVSYPEPHLMDYLELVEIHQSNLWPRGNPTPITTHRAYARLPEIYNDTDLPLTVRYEIEHEEGQGFYWANDIRNVEIPPRSRLSLHRVTRYLRIDAICNAQRWRHWESPLLLAPHEGFQTTEEVPIYELRYSLERPTEDSINCFAKQRRPNSDFDEWAWMSVSRSAANRLSKRGTEFFSDASSSPVDPLMTGGATFQQLVATCYQYERVWPNSSSRWFLPRNGNGEVWKWEVSAHGSSWVLEGIVGEYRPSSDPWGKFNLDAYPDPRYVMPGAYALMDSLRESSWNTQFWSPQENIWQECHLKVTGSNGSYRVVATGANGQLSDIQYSAFSDSCRISGSWAKAQSSGTFTFDFPLSNPTSFDGHWANSDGLSGGAWNGHRSDPRYAVCRFVNNSSSQMYLEFKWEPDADVEQVLLDAGASHVTSVLEDTSPSPQLWFEARPGDPSSRTSVTPAVDSTFHNHLTNQSLAYSCGTSDTYRYNELTKFTEDPLNVISFIKYVREPDGSLNVQY